MRLVRVWLHHVAALRDWQDNQRQTKGAREDGDNTSDWPSCDYSPGRMHWLFVSSLVCVAARKVVVLR